VDAQEDSNLLVTRGRGGDWVHGMVFVRTQGGEEGCGAGFLEKRTGGQS